MKNYLRGAAALVALAAFAGISGAARAADVPYSEPAYSWSGFYIGGYVGAGTSVSRTELDFGDPEEDFLALDADFNGFGGQGILGGALAGFNWQVSDRFVLGIQGDIGWTDLDSEVKVLGGKLKGGPDFVASGSLRAGALVTPETLLYIIGGYSYAEYEAEASFIDDNFDQNYDGYHVGAGMETRLTDRLTARIEYRYTDFGGEDWDTNGILEVSPSVHTGTLGIAYNLFPVAGDGEVASPVADVVEPTVSWTGLYLGVNGGAGAVVNQVEIPELGDFDGVGGEGILGSLMAGFNWQVGSQFVLGIQGDIGLADLKSELDGSLVIAEAIGFDLDAEAKLDWFASASLRAGWLPSPDTMIYVIGGYSYAHYELDASLDAFNPVGPERENIFDVKEKQDYDGYHVGAGIEAMLTDNLTARAEYRFTQYGKEDWGVDGLDVEPSSHAGTIGIAWLFNSL